MRHGLGHPIGAQTGLGAQTPDCIRLGLIATLDERAQLDITNPIL